MAFNWRSLNPFILERRATWLSALSAIDQGTTGSTALVIDARLRVAGKANREFPQHFPAPGQVVAHH